MYLYANKRESFWKYVNEESETLRARNLIKALGFDNPAEDSNPDVDFSVEVEFEIGYWRKHPDLHGMIVQNFGGGEDDCSPVPLTEEDIVDIMTKIENGEYAKGTSGFFFGQSDDSDETRESDLNIFNNALGAIKNGYEIYYRASW